MSIGDRINVTLGLLKEEDTYDNRIEIMANLKVVKEIFCPVHGRQLIRIYDINN